MTFRLHAQQKSPDDLVDVLHFPGVGKLTEIVRGGFRLVLIADRVSRLYG